jgi:UDP-N-acetylmuramate dehydrogenase
MKKDLQQAVSKAFPKILFDENLKNHCTFNTGGVADMFYYLLDSKELPKLVNFAKKYKLPYFLFGKGSNILFDDKGFRGLVIKNECSNIEIKRNDVQADAGVAISNLVKETVKKGLSPMEKWTGLPGTVGGAVYGNAGSNGLQTKDILDSAEIFDTKTGKIKKVKNKYFNFQYRSSILKKTGEVLISATFKLTRSKKTEEQTKKEQKKLIKERLQKQPFGLSSGCFFRNPSGEHPAGYLIEKANLKGKKIGKAQISDKHANFILNLGGAKSSDIIKLATLIQTTVKTKFKVKLEPEVQILGEKKLIKI